MRRRQNEGAANATVNRERAVLASLFVQATKWGLADHNPVPSTDRRKEDNVAPRPLSDVETDKLMSVIPRHYKPFVVFALNTGLRLGELQTQRWKDINMTDRTLTVTRPKSGKSETIPLNKTAYAVLIEADQTGDFVFPTIPSSLSVIFPRYVRKAGLEGVTFHCLRDTFISKVAETASAATVMALARHRDFRTTQRYLKLDDGHLREAAESVVFAQNDSLTGTKSGTGILFTE
jgi:integrase